MAGPLLLVLFALTLAAAALGAFAAGVVAQAMLEPAAPQLVTPALGVAEIGLFVMAGALAFGFALFLIFVERRMARPMRAILRSAYGLAGGDTRSGIACVERGDGFGDLAAALETLRARLAETPRIAQAQDGEIKLSLIGASGEMFSRTIVKVEDAIEELKRSGRELTGLNAEAVIRLERTLAQAEEATSALAGAATRADLHHLPGRIEDILGSLGAAGAELKGASGLARAETEDFVAGAGRLQEELSGAVGALKEAGRLLEGQTAQAQTKLDRFVAMAGEGLRAIEAHLGAAVVSLASGSIEVRRNAAALAECAQAAANKLASAAADFHKAGRILADEATSVRHELSSGADDFRRAQKSVAAFLITLNGNRADSSAVTTADAEEREAEAESDSVARALEFLAPAKQGADQPAGFDFASAAEAVLTLARAIEMLENRTSELAQRLRSDAANDSCADSAQADLDADKTIAAVMSSIEHMNAIAAAISEAGDAMAKRRAVH